MKFLASLCFLLFGWVTVMGGAFTTTTSGNFSTGATWVGGSAPSAAGDTWTISAGHTVVYDVDNSADAGWGASVVTGDLVMTNLNALVQLKMQGNLSGAGNWRIGAASNPVSFLAKSLPQVTIQFTGSAQCTMAGTNNLGWYGDSSHLTNAWLSASVSANATSIVVSNMPPNINTNDVFWLGRLATVGLAGEMYVVGSVSGTTINIKQLPFGSETNVWYGNTFKTNVPTTRAIGDPVCFLSQPVVFFEPVQRTVSTITASKSNVMTGVQCQNLAKGLCTSANCSGWTAYNNTGNVCGQGSLAGGSVASWTIYGNTFIGCTAAAAGFSSCISWAAYNNTLGNCTSGLGASASTGWTAYGNTAYNGSNGGLGSNSSFWTVYSNIVSSCSNGALGYNLCQAWTVFSNTVNNYSNGLGYSNCSGWTVFGNTINNGTGGGFSQAGIGWTTFDNNTTNSSPLFVSCNRMLSIGNTTKYTTDTLSTGSSGYDFLQFDYSYFLGNYGNVQRTNLLGLNSLFLHTTTVTNQPVAYSVPVSIRAGGSRVVTVFGYLTNQMAYYAQTTPYYSWAANPHSATLIGTAGASSGGWTNIILTLSNTNTVPISFSIFVDARATATNAVGYTYVNVSSKDAIQTTQ